MNFDTMRMNVRRSTIPVGGYNTIMLLFRLRWGMR